MTFDIDATHIAGNEGKTFIAAASPWFFTHYSYKKWLWHANEFQFSTRWEQLIEHRDQVDIVEVISWNNYGESTYVGPVGAEQPGSQAWVTGYDHTPWLKMTSMYARAFKSGTAPPIEEDRLFVFSRSHPASADAPDGLGRPNHWDWEEDVLQAVVFSTAPGTVTLTSGGNSKAFEIQAGISKVRVENAPGMIRATLSRDGKTVVDVAPAAEEFQFTTSPEHYNFNAYIASKGSSSG